MFDVFPLFLPLLCHPCLVSRLKPARKQCKKGEFIAPQQEQTGKEYSELSCLPQDCSSREAADSDACFRPSRSTDIWFV